MATHLEMTIIPVVIGAVTACALLGVRFLVFRFLHRWTQKTKTDLDNLIVGSVKAPSLYWCLAIGIYAGIEASVLPPKHIGYLHTVIDVLVIISVTLAAANISGKLFRNYVEAANLPIPTTGLAYTIIKGTIFAIGFLIMLNALGVSITPLLTALGVGGLAVALALQDTLANFFAGIHILMEKSIRVGDFIKLESGQEGYVEDITWRTTRVRMLPNNTVIIPNSALAKSIVTNYYLPEKRMFVAIQVSVSYSSDPEKVEKILKEEAESCIGQVPGLLAEPEPSVRLIPGFGVSSLDFSLNCQVQEFTDQYLVQHELRKRILRRFAEEGIEIPFPHRTVYLREEKEWKR